MFKRELAIIIGARAERIPPPKLRRNRSVCDCFSGFADKGENMDIFEDLAERYIVSVSEFISFGLLVVRGVICWIICVENCRTNGNLANTIF